MLARGRHGSRDAHDIERQLARYRLHAGDRRDCLGCVLGVAQLGREEAVAAEALAGLAEAGQTEALVAVLGFQASLLNLREL
ncbi:hypothetical protein HRbin41_01348 [bacterium HR41]|nr:hypothetical protein HRbin41_01348 [bacterium HR41]